MIIVGSLCPSFTAQMVWKDKISDITDQDLRSHYTLLFFYAVDFSLVCPTELRSLQAHAQDFKERNVDVIAVSVDSVYTHIAWLKTPSDKNGIEGFSFKLLSDQPNTLSKQFGVFDPELGLSNRGTFFIDKELIVQYGEVNNKAFGRSIPEILRVIDAIQFVETYGLSCPANWQSGQEGLKRL